MEWLVWAMQQQHPLRPERINPALWRGHLDTLLAQPRKVTRVNHHPALPFAEVPAFIENLQGREAIAALALEFAILTAARTAEVTGAKRREVTDALWLVPADRMKAGRPHRVPLVPRAIAIIERAKVQDPDSEYLFSHNRKPLSNMAMLTLLKRMKHKDISLMRTALMSAPPVHAATAITRLRRVATFRSVIGCFNSAQSANDPSASSKPSSLP